MHLYVQWAILTGTFPAPCPRLRRQVLACHVYLLFEEVLQTLSSLLNELV